MKKPKFLPSSFSILAFLFSIWFCRCLYNSPRFVESRQISTLTVGQTWQRTDIDHNPFEPFFTIEKRIITLKGEYVQYVINGTDTFNCRKSLFVHHSNIKE